MATWLPYLEDVVFCCRRDVPLCHRRPRQVVDVGCVASVDEEELRRSVLCVFWCLFGANGIEVPDVDAAVGAC